MKILNNISLPATREEALEECKKECPGPEKCSHGGEILYQPHSDVYGPYFIECPIYNKWKHQMDLNKRIMDAIPKKFWDRSLENFQPYNKDLKAALNIAQKYAANKAWSMGANLIFLGRYGVGKTHLMAGIAREAIKNGYIAVFIVASSLTFSDLNEIKTLFKKIRDVDLVAIDDVSTETEHKFILSEIFDLINYRYEAEKGLLLSSNLQPSEFKKTLGERILDRLIERSVFLNISNTESYRKRKRTDYLGWMKG
ncbi:MAG: ATP-binding protein [Thermoplasmata archaeon]|nr:MAG: ATP-binding protein [Thermoplasmata archaeon]